MEKLILNENNSKSICKVVYPENSKHVFTKLDNCKNSIFLAGPCPRDLNEMNDDWRNEAIQILSDLNFDGIILNPTNKYFDETDTTHLEKQFMWEYEAMHKASAIVFWIERSEKFPARTTNIEFGDWLGKTGVYYGWSNKALHNNYLDIRLKTLNIHRYKSLKYMLTTVVNDLNRKSQNWFLSDTHFSQQRTLDLSKRPFLNVNEMDLTMISNWNKNIRKNDVVYFLGDFGANFDYLKLLNFSKLNFVLGNYERVDSDGNDISKISSKNLLKFDNVKIFDRAECSVKLKNGQIVYLVHEPIAPKNYSADYSDKLYLYGHIHGRTFYKKNGTDVGVDVHNFTPISEDEIIWRLNAIKYLDENVWEINCK